MLTLDDVDALTVAATDGQLWRLPNTSVPAPADMRDRVLSYLLRQDSGTMLSLTVRAPDGRAVSHTSFWDIDAANRRVETGGSWYAESVQGTGLNTEAKLLMLAHAFEQWECVAVELRASSVNQRSRRAIEGLGAKLDGVFRSHQVMADGNLRDTAVYSILADEWPGGPCPSSPPPRPPQNLTGLLAAQRAACDGKHMAYKITTTDGQTFECSEVGHQVDGSVSIQVGGRKLRLAPHYWQMIEGEPGDRDMEEPVR